MSIQAITALSSEIDALRSDLAAFTTAVSAISDRLAAVEIRAQATERALTHRRPLGKWATWTDDDLAQITQHLATYGPQLKSALAHHYGRAMLAEAIDREFIYESTRGGARILSASPTARGTSAASVIDHLARNGATWLHSSPAERPTLADHFNKNTLPRDIADALATGEIVRGRGASQGGRPPQIYAVRPSSVDTPLPAVVDGVPVTWHL